MNEKINKYQQMLEQAKGTKNHLIKKKKEIEEKLKNLNIRKESIEKAQVLIQTTAKETQENLRYQIEDIVNTALDTCFPNMYSFRVEFEIKRGRTEADMFLLDENNNRINPLDSSGGGVVDVVCFALRLSMWTLGKTDNIMVLDEPFKFLSSDLRPLAVEILKTLSEKLDLQIIMVTHMEEFIEGSDKIFKVKKLKENSIVE